MCWREPGAPTRAGLLMEMARFEDPDTLALRMARKHVLEHQRDPSDDDNPGLTLLQTLGDRPVRAVPPRQIERVHAWSLPCIADGLRRPPTAALFARPTSPRSPIGFSNSGFTPLRTVPSRAAAVVQLEEGRNNQNPTAPGHLGHALQVELDQARAEIVALQTREQELTRMVNLLLDRNQDIETRDEVRLMRLAQNPHPLTNQGRCWTQPKQSAMGKQVGQPKEEGGVEAEQQTGQKLPEEESQSALHKAAQQGRGAFPTAAATFPASLTIPSSSSSSSASSTSTSTPIQMGASDATFLHLLPSPLPVAISSSSSASACSTVLSPMMAVLQGATIVRLESCQSGGRASRQNVFVRSNEVPNAQGKSPVRRQIKAQHLLPPNPPSAQDQALMGRDSFLRDMRIERLRLMPVSTAGGEANSARADLVILADRGRCGSQVQVVSEEVVQRDRRQLGMPLEAGAGPFGGKSRSILKSRDQSSQSAVRRM